MAVEVEQRTKALDKRDGAAARVGDAVLACAAALPREHLVQDAGGVSGTEWDASVRKCAIVV
jgi:hypothetical protein